MSNTRLRPIYVDARNGRGISLAGVRLVVSYQGEEVGTQTKRTQGYTRIEVPSDGEITLSAVWQGNVSEPVKVAPDRSELVFKFPYAGAPSVMLVCALPKETHAVRSILDESSPEPIAGPPGDPNHYWTGAFGSNGVTRRVLVATSGMGNNNAAIVATHALRSFRDDIDYLIMVGIAGGCPNPAKPDEHVRLGDIVVLNEQGLLQYDFTKRTNTGDAIRRSAQLPSKALLEAAKTLAIRELAGETPWEETIAAAAKGESRRPAAKTDLLHDAHGAHVAHPKQARRKNGKPLVHHGAIGSANILLKDPSSRDMLRDSYNVRAVEMEGSGLQDAGWHVEKDIMVVRGVCDYCDPFKTDTWQAYAALVAAAYARALVEAIPAAHFV